MDRNIHISVAHIDHFMHDLKEFEDDYTRKFSDKRRKKESLLARYLLNSLCLKTKSLDLFRLGFSKDEFGCPFFANLRSLHCSITHCNGWVIVALSNQLIGIDLEMICAEQKDDLRIAFNDNEWATIKDDSLDVFKNFSFKESYSKYLGKGFNIEPKDISVNENIFNLSYVFSLGFSKNKYIFTLVAELEVIDESIDWGEFNLNERVFK